MCHWHSTDVDLDITILGPTNSGTWDHVFLQERSREHCMVIYTSKQLTESFTTC